jgi:hypothetical protein
VVRVVAVDRVADSSGLRPDQLWSSVQQPKQPRGKIGWEPAGQPDELAARDGLAAAQVRQQCPQLGRICRVQIAEASAGQATRVNR